MSRDLDGGWSGIDGTRGRRFLKKVTKVAFRFCNRMIYPFVHKERQALATLSAVNITVRFMASVQSLMVSTKTRTHTLVTSTEFFQVAAAMWLFSERETLINLFIP